MADYLHPECNISLPDQYEMFLIRSKMNEFPSNFGDKTLCTMGCLEILNSEHVTVCPELTNKGNNSVEYKNILKGSMKQFKENNEEKE